MFISNRNTSKSFEPAYMVIGESNHGAVGIINTQTFQVEKLFELEESGAGIAIDKNSIEVKIIIILVR